MASAKIEQFMLKPQSAKEVALKQGEQVDLLVWQKTDLGFKVIINNAYAGLVYQDQLFKYIHTGDKLPGYVSAIRPDGKIEISLQPLGQAAATDFATTLLEYMERNGGRCHLGDKSDPEEIKRQFQVSKKVYKKAVGDLYKRRLIVITDNGIELVPTKE